MQPPRPPARPQPGAAVRLPGYSYDPRTHAYRNLSTGRLVARQAITDLLRDVADGAGNRLAALGRSAVRGDLTPRQFYELMQREVKYAYNACAALAAGGWDRLTAREWGGNGIRLRAQYAYLRDFAADIAAGKLTEAQAAARASTYGDSAYSRYWELDRQKQETAGVTMARWQTAGDDKVCVECQALERQGARPIRVWPLPGQVHPGCRCDLVYET